MESITNPPADSCSPKLQSNLSPADTIFETFARMETLITRAAEIKLHPVGIGIPGGSLDMEDALAMLGHVLDAERDTETLTDFLIGDVYRAMCRIVPDGRKRGTWLLDWCCKPERYGRDLGPLVKARLMERMAKAARLAEYWPAEKRAAGIPLWLFQECRDGGLPFDTAESFVSRWRAGERVTRDAVRQCALNLRSHIDTVLINTVIGVSNDNCNTTPRFPEVDAHLFNTVEEESRDPEMAEQSFMVGLPLRTVNKLHQLAAAAHMSEREYLEMLIEQQPVPATAEERQAQATEVLAERGEIRRPDLIRALEDRGLSEIDARSAIADLRRGGTLKAEHRGDGIDEVVYRLSALVGAGP